MVKGPAGTTEAGASAMAEWHRARRSARRRRPISTFLVLAAVVFVVVGSWRGSGWLATAAIPAGAAAWLVRPDPDPDRWRRGADGEVATAAVLARLSRRWVVLHDRAVPGSRANIDHLVIGPTGVWVVDTKTVRSPLRVRAIDTGAVAWQAEVVSDRLAVGAAPLVAVHGAGLRRRGKRSAGVRVVPVRRLNRRLRRGRRILSWTEVGALARVAAEAFPPR